MNCIFCKIINNEIPSYTYYENDKVKCFLDVNPLSNGHTLIVPKKHFVDVNDIDLETLLEIQKTSKLIVKLLNDKLNPDGIKLVQNNGSLQEIKHYHLHIIPSYKSKNNNLKVEEVFNLLNK